ncbi:MAG: MFS transporter [Chloroflexi bacterium]|nr:MFS transporter [Chloroflexota bacterium]
MSKQTVGGASQAPQAAAAQRRTRTLLMLGLPLFWSALYVYSSYLSVYAKEVGASLAMVGVIVASYGFTQLVVRIPLGIASDRIGKRKPFALMGGLVGALSCATLLAAPQPWVLLLGRGLAGVAAATWVATSVLLISSYPSDQVARATSVGMALTGLGSTVSSYLGGWLADVAGPRAPFWAGIAIGLTCTAVFALIVEPPAPNRTPLTVRSLLAVGRTPILLIGSLLALLYQYISFAMGSAFVPVYARELSATSSQLGALMALMQGFYALVAYFAGSIGARLGNRNTAVVGLGLTALSALLTPHAQTMGVLYVLRALHGVGMGLSAPVLMAVPMAAIAPEKRGAAMGFYQAIYAIGMVAGPAISGVLADGPGLAFTFYTVGGLGLLAVVIAAVFLPGEKRRADKTASA